MYLNKAMVSATSPATPRREPCLRAARYAHFRWRPIACIKRPTALKLERSSITTWVVFGRQAETCAQYLRRGAVPMSKDISKTRSWRGRREAVPHRDSRRARAVWAPFLRCRGRRRRNHDLYEPMPKRHKKLPRMMQ